jgi:Cu-Zn family superoxide dismutase
MLKSVYSAVLFFLFLSVLTYGQQSSSADEVNSAIAVLEPTQGSKVTGTLTFTKLQEGSGVQITGDIQGLTQGKHGFHIHQYGDISSPDGKSAGDHYNPTNTRHAGPDDAMHHAGDMGNITAGSDGVAHVDIKLSTDISSLIGRSVVVHEKEDDLMSQPAGNAGARIAVGVIGIAKAK